MIDYNVEDFIEEGIEESNLFVNHYIKPKLAASQH